MPLPTTLPTREYNKFVQNGSDETCVRILGEVSVISGGGSGTKWRSTYEGTTVPGTETTGITFTVGVALTRQLAQLNASCLRICLFKIKKNGSLLMSGRTGPGNYNLALNFSPTETILTGDVITVTFTGLSGESASDLEMSLSGTEA